MWLEPMSDQKPDKDKDEALAEAKRIMERLVKSPPKPHQPLTPKQKARPASKGRVRKGRSRS